MLICINILDVVLDLILKYFFTLKQRRLKECNNFWSIDNRGKDILILDKCPTQGLKHKLSAEKIYSVNFTKGNTKLCLSLHYNGANSYLFVDGTEIIKFKAKDPKITPYELYLGNISKDW